MRAISAFPWQRDRAERKIKAADVRVGRLFWPCAIASLIIITLIARWPYLDVPISADEGGYATAAYWWARGDTLYRDITITRPQGIFVVFRLIQAGGLGTTRGIHFVAMGCAALMSLLLLAGAGRVWGRGVGFGAGALFSLIMATPHVEGYSANAGFFMLLPLLGSFYLLLRADDTPLGKRSGLLWLAASGAAGALAFLIKPSGFAAGALAAFWLLRRWRTEEATFGSWLRAELALAGGFIAGILPALIHGLVTAPESYLNAVVFYRIQRDSVVGGAVDHQLTYLRTNSLYVLARLPILLIAPVGLCVRTVAPTGRALLWFWLATSVAGAALGGNWFLHYYQQLMPPLAVATVLGLRATMGRSRNPARLFAQAIAVGGILLLGFNLSAAFVRPINPADLPEYEPTIAVVDDIAAYLRAHTAPSDTIYVAYDHADIYYFAERRPAARWLHFRELARTPGAFDEQVDHIANPATAPRYIVGAQEFTRWGFDPDGRLRTIIERDYVKETTIGGVPVYRRK